MAYYHRLTKSISRDLAAYPDEEELLRSQWVQGMQLVTNLLLHFSVHPAPAMLPAL